MADTQPEELVNRNCGYCGTTFFCSQERLLNHVHQCETDNLKEYPVLSER